MNDCKNEKNFRNDGLYKTFFSIHHFLKLLLSSSLRYCGIDIIVYIFNSLNQLTNREKMPELAEVESSRAFISGLLTGYTIEEVHTREQGGGPRDGMFDDLVFELHPEGSGK